MKKKKQPLGGPCNNVLYSCTLASINGCLQSHLGAIEKSQWKWCPTPYQCWLKYDYSGVCEVVEHTQPDEEASESRETQ